MPVWAEMGLPSCSPVRRRPMTRSGAKWKSPANRWKSEAKCRPAKLLRRVTPVYPSLARQARVGGLVRLRAIISEDGSGRRLEVLSGHPLLVGSAVEAVKRWLYRPTLLNRRAVAVITQIDVNFRLR